MKTLKNIFLFSLVLIISISFMSLKPKYNSITRDVTIILQDTTKWVAPASANDVTNPYEVNDDNIAEGKLVYRKNCRSCHGRTGDGNGVEAADLTPPPTNFNDSCYVKQTDGAKFWKISNGRNDMKAYDKILEDEDIWNVIMYIKTFSNVSND